MKYVFAIPLVVVFTIFTVAVYVALCTPGLAPGNPIATKNNTSLPGKHQFSLLHMEQ